MNLFNLFAKLSLDSSEYESGIEKATSDGKGFASTLKTGLATAGKTAAAGIGVIAGAATAAVGGLMALEASTEEYCVAQGKLNTAFEAAGYSADVAKGAYNDFYAILGDTDTATEASQLLAKLALSAEDMSTWTNISAGVWGTFGDSLPIEGLIEASNETAKVGTVTGVLADALNWAGISEDEFNAKLAECSDETERNRLIMETLSKTYDDASEAFYKNNESLVASREAQAKMDESLAKLGNTVSSIKTRIMSDLLPGLSSVVEGFAGMISGVEGSDEQFSNAVSGLISVGVSKLPEFMAFGGQILSSVASGVVSSIPVLIAAVPEIASALVSSISTVGPSLMASGGEILSQIYNGVMAAIPMLSSGAVSIMTSLGNYLSANLPTLLQRGLEAVVALTGSIRENAGLIVDGAISLALSLAQGLADSIPTIVQNVPTIVTNIAGVINDNAPKVFAAAVQLIGTLVKGLISAIPTIIQNLPQIINAIVNVFLAFNWLNLGKNIITGLSNGIKSMVSSVKNVANQVVQAIKGGISRLPSQMATIGKNIVQGLWNGIKGMGSWLTSQVKNFFGGIVSGVKNFLGIHSPSRVFAGIGGFMAEGVGVGWNDEFPSVKKGIESEMDFGTASVGMSTGLSGANGRSTGGVSYGTVNFTINARDGQSARDIAVEVAELLQIEVDRGNSVYA